MTYQVSPTLPFSLLSYRPILAIFRPEGRGEQKETILRGCFSI